MYFIFYVRQFFNISFNNKQKWNVNTEKWDMFQFVLTDIYLQCIQKCSVEKMFSSVIRDGFSANYLYKIKLFVDNSPRETHRFSWKISKYIDQCLNCFRKILLNFCKKQLWKKACNVGSYLDFSFQKKIDCAIKTKITNTKSQILTFS